MDTLKITTAERKELLSKARTWALNPTQPKILASVDREDGTSIRFAGEKGRMYYATLRLESTDGIVDDAPKATIKRFVESI